MSESTIKIFLREVFSSASIQPTSPEIDSMVDDFYGLVLNQPEKIVTLRNLALQRAPRQVLFRNFSPELALAIFKNNRKFKALLSDPSLDAGKNPEMLDFSILEESFGNYEELDS